MGNFNAKFYTHWVMNQSLTTINNEETFASELLENLEEMFP